MPLGMSFNVDLACEYGIESAILINYLQRAIREKYSRPAFFLEDKLWAKFTKSKLFAAFPFWRKREPEKYLNILIEKGVIEIKKFYVTDHGRYFWVSFVDSQRFGVDKISIVNKDHTTILRYLEERKRNLYQTAPSRAGHLP
jgi:hypothetical protein